MFEMGITVGLGLLITLLKAPPKIKVLILSYPVAMDIIIFVLLCLLHWGTFSGVMVATIGALTCSLVLQAGKKVYGHMMTIDGKRVYMRGMVDLSPKLNKRKPVAVAAMA